MMNVQRMRWIVDETAAGELPPVIVDAARRWQADTISHVRSSGNHVSRIVLPDGTVAYLRLTPAAERSRAALEAELVFVEHVARSGVAVARPLPSASGTLIEEIDEPAENPNAASYFAVVFSGLRGRQLEHGELTEPHYRAWGRALAQLHLASETFPLHPARPSLLDEIRRARTTLPQSEDKVAQVLDAGAAWLETMPVNPTAYGLLHGDCELDNLIWDGLKPQVLDFGSALYAPFLVDVAIALQEVWTPETPDRNDRVAWFCDGYRELRTLPSEFLESLPRVITLLTALKIAQLLHAYVPLSTGREDAESITADPPWLVNMRARHQRWLEVQRASLEWR